MSPTERQARRDISVNTSSEDRHTFQKQDRPTPIQEKFSRMHDATRRNAYIYREWRMKVDSITATSPDKSKNKHQSKQAHTSGVAWAIFAWIPRQVYGDLRCPQEKKFEKGTQFWALHIVRSTDIIWVPKPLLVCPLNGQARCKKIHFYTAFHLCPPDHGPSRMDTYLHSIHPSYTPAYLPWLKVPVVDNTCRHNGHVIPVAVRAVVLARVVTQTCIQVIATCIACAHVKKKNKRSREKKATTMPKNMLVLLKMERK